MTASPSGMLRTGGGLLNIAANKQEQFETLCGLIGRKDLVNDPRFAGREDRKRNRFALNAEDRDGACRQDGHGVGRGLQSARCSGRRGARRAVGARASADVDARAVADFRGAARRRPAGSGGPLRLSAGKRRPGTCDAAATARRGQQRYPAELGYTNSEIDDLARENVT